MKLLARAESGASASQKPLSDPPAARLRDAFRDSPTLPLGVALAVLFVGFGIAEPEAFLSSFNIKSLLTDASVLLLLAVGMTYVITTAGIDLSVGAVLVFSGVVSSEVMTSLGGEGWGTVFVGLLVAIAAGLAWGLVNGLLVARLRIPPLIATLGTLGTSYGLAKVITNGTDVRGAPQELVKTLGLGSLFGVVPWLVVIAAVITGVAAIWLAQTRFGRYTVAIGANPEAVRRVGVRVDLHLIKVYALCGLLAGLAGYLSLARFATTTIAGHSSDNLAVVTAVVLGGTSLFGGIGTVIGSLIGVFIPVVLQNGFVILGIQPFWQEVATGVVLVVAIYADQLRRSSREQR